MTLQFKTAFKFYIDLLLHARPEHEIINYLAERSIGNHILFHRDVIYNYKGLKINCGHVMENCKVASRTFEPEVAKLINSYKEGTFIDCGAHIGKYSLIAARNGMNVIAIEGSPVNFELILKNRDLNHSNFEGRNYLLGNEHGFIDFYISKLHPATNSISPIVNSDKTEMEIIKLDDLCLGLQYLNLIKIDVEGSEAEVIKGGWKLLSKFHPDIIFEAADDDSYLETAKLLIKLGYIDFKLIDEYTYFTKWEPRA